MVDLGAGISPFLDVFTEGSTTLALDQSKRCCEIQAARGHRAEHIRPDSLGSLESSSVRLFHASYSAPYYSIGDEASTLVDNVTDVLEPGGIALIGSTLHDSMHFVYEGIVRSLRKGIIPTNVWRIGMPPINILTDVLFAAAVQNKAKIGDLEIAGFRQPVLGITGANPQPKNGLPNFIMIRRPQ